MITWVVCSCSDHLIFLCLMQTHPAQRKILLTILCTQQDKHSVSPAWPSVKPVLIRSHRKQSSADEDVPEPPRAAARELETVHLGKTLLSLCRNKLASYKMRYICSFQFTVATFASIASIASIHLPHLLRWPLSSRVFWDLGEAPFYGKTKMYTGKTISSGE